MKKPYSDLLFDNTWSDWLAYRKEIKKPYKSARSEQMQLNWFAQQRLTLEEAIEAINQSMRAGWQGIFPPKNKPNGAKRQESIRGLAGFTSNTESLKSDLAQLHNGGTAGFNPEIPF